VRIWHAGNYLPNLFYKGWMPPHPTFYAKAEVYKKHGVFNTTLKFAADYELMLRFILKAGIKTAYINSFLVRMRVGGTSNRSLLNRLKANIEDRKAWRINGLKPGLLTLLLKPFSKISQYRF
jgi:glycosyltransferase